ncbi:MAG: NAD-dependent epimerase/dehydratase family protein [Planctomycetaceae bacterium]|nr:NAD-dependent epimerase/dehydratase family protein [Planctomycetaceae bacterium]
MQNATPHCATSTARLVGITGVSGFIGQRLARECLLNGDHVRGFDLHVSPDHIPGLEFVQGDITRAEEVDRFCQRCDILVHAAAIVREGGNRSLFEQVNVEGTRHVVQAALRSGVRRLVHLSSVMVYGTHCTGVLTEDCPLDGSGNIYCETKIESERIALGAHATDGLSVNIVRCGDVYGPGSIPWTLRPVRTMQAGIFALPGRGDGLINPIYIDDLVNGIVRCMETSLGGEIFNMTEGTAVPARLFFADYAREIGIRKIRTGPAWLLRNLLIAKNAAFGLFGIPPRIHPDSIAYLSRQGVYSNEKARRLIGFHPQFPLTEGMRTTIDWLRQVDLLPVRHQSPCMGVADH